MQNSIRILLIEAQTLTRAGLKTILGGAAGLESFVKLRPDVTLLGLRLPDSCAIDVLSDYFAADRNAKIIVLAEHAGDAEISKSLKQGALGYVCKDVSESDLIKAIRAVAAGKKYISADIAGILSENFGHDELTATEQKILGALVAGKSNKEIAFAFNVTENTVKTHVKNIFDKLGVSDRTSAATSAIRRGLVRMEN